MTQSINFTFVFEIICKSKRDLIKYLQCEDFITKNFNYVKCKQDKALTEFHESLSC